MKNNLIEEDIVRIKKLINNVLKERFDLTNDEKIITEAPIIPTLLNKYLGRGVVSKLETSMGDDVIKNLERLFAKSESNFTKNSIGKIVVKSASGTEVEMRTIAAALDAVAKGKMNVNDVVKLLPRKLKDGTDFRTIFDTQLRKAKPKPTTPPTTPPITSTTAAGGPTQFTIPTIGAQLDDLSLVNVTEVEARLQNIFPKAPSSDIKRMSNNLKIANPRTQQAFDKSYIEAVNGFSPQYQKILSKPSTIKQMRGMYDSLPKWGKRIFWIITIPGGYLLLKKLKVPVDKLTGWVVDEWKNIITDQAQGVETKFTSPSDSEPQKEKIIY